MDANQYKNFPESQKVTNGIMEFQSYELPIDLSLGTIEVLKLIRSRFIKCFGIELQLITPIGNVDFTFFRARPLLEIANKHLACEYSYPPVSKCVNWQRTNIPLNPVFYCSDNPFTAMLEVLNDRSVEEQRMALAVWKLKTNNTLKYTPFAYSGVHIKNPLS